MPNMEAIISGHNRKLLKNDILNVHKVQRQLRPNQQVTLGKVKLDRQMKSATVRKELNIVQIRW